MKKANYIYRGARYVVAAEPPPIPEDAKKQQGVDDNTKQQVCQFVTVLVQGTESIQQWMEQNGIWGDAEMRIDTALELYQQVEQATGEALGGCKVAATARFREAMTRIAKELPPPTPEKQKELQAVLEKIQATVSATEGVKKTLVNLGMQGADKLMDQAKQAMSELLKILQESGPQQMSQFQQQATK